MVMDQPRICFPSLWGDRGGAPPTGVDLHWRRGTFFRQHWRCYTYNLCIVLHGHIYLFYQRWCVPKVSICNGYDFVKGRNWSPPLPKVETFTRMLEWLILTRRGITAGRSTSSPIVFFSGLSLYMFFPPRFINFYQNKRCDPPLIPLTWHKV